MRKVKFLFAALPVLFFANCSGDLCEDFGENPGETILEKAPLTRAESNILSSTFDESDLNDFVDAYGELMKTMWDINSKKDKEDLACMANLYKLCQENPDEYVEMLESEAKSVFSVEELKSIERLHEKLTSASASLARSQKQKTVSKECSEALVSALACQIPAFKTDLVDMNQVTRVKTESEADCIKKCDKAFRDELTKIARNTICESTANIVAICASLGTVSIPSLLAALASAVDAYADVVKAQDTYNSCVKKC